MSTLTIKPPINGSGTDLQTLLNVKCDLTQKIVGDQRFSNFCIDGLSRL